MLKEYFNNALLGCITISIMLALSHSKMRSVTKTASGIMVICIVMLPLVDILVDFEWRSSYLEFMDGIDYETSDSGIKASFESGIEDYIEDKYGLPSGSVAVKADGFSLEVLKAERIYVNLSGKGALLDYKRLELDLAEKFTRGGECEVSVDIG